MTVWGERPSLRHWTDSPTPTRSIWGEKALSSAVTVAPYSSACAGRGAVRTATTTMHAAASPRLIGADASTHAYER